MSSVLISASRNGRFLVVVEETQTCRVRPVVAVLSGSVHPSVPCCASGAAQVCLRTMLLCSIFLVPPSAERDRAEQDGVGPDVVLKKSRKRAEERK